MFNASSNIHKTMSNKPTHLSYTFNHSNNNERIYKHVVVKLFSVKCSVVKLGNGDVHLVSNFSDNYIQCLVNNTVYHQGFVEKFYLFKVQQ